ncbi:deoxyribonuclease IV (plasmid) [Haloferax mediterranei ATCC 33500]|uniref:Probable endonuclease 4 n=1 Tax=Haloferax mediterranei (strain ATCC 33500 / DSM 1411 / JCM 8866 / NBRC 14739 / NCIMB 2177 / R-4) TaxID=523841 RepID=I3RA80_HALMT|nr:deoxyribonuclease IV [Haloferax mediterranei]AFK21140.1 endonuclease IV / deoxyribonuclease IV [Haloferax mediterranei ATCC 33500]AHZ24336.1 endonuclease IV [Haloferax mediterranei ATCC 33500]ELZ97070.1 endonuclease IV / deoxyribonuclease IV [Haloferax mediterranei ATCC 33500]MDX5990183.1 deoxyribonuclease IV [Haloferax mediterranei ATCC 33500]QCQ76744.1 deoxyribonuclease IV [Haloferax mediterranei ATCC 33500]
MFRLGAHVSISDGFEAAVEHEVELGGNCGQLFVGSPRGWTISEVDETEANAFRDAADEQDVGLWVIHGTYLINLATPKDDLARKSIDCLQDELDAAATLDIPYYVFHPGAHTGAGEETGIDNVGKRLSDIDVPSGVTLLLENTAGKGTTVGKRLEDLDTMVKTSDYEYGDLGICLDTCHLFAAGYDFTDEAAMGELVDEIDSTVGIENVHYLHLNDSKHPLGSEKDEHEHIGEGKIGEAGFRQFVNHDTLREKPMVLETPKDERGDVWNIEKVTALRTDG